MWEDWVHRKKKPQKIIISEFLFTNIETPINKNCLQLCVMLSERLGSWKPFD